MNRHGIGHRFCNQDFGRNGHLTCGNISVNGRNYYSYSTVFGQWVDMEKKVCLVYQGGTSVSSSKHMLHSGMFPGDVHVFPYDDHHFGYHYGYHGCQLLYWSGSTFGWDERKRLLDYWIDRQFTSFRVIVNGNVKGLENVSFGYWGYVEELCSLYKDTSVNKWLKSFVCESDDYGNQKKKMVKLLKSGERDVRTITDALFGEGTFQTYYDYCERFRKTDKKKEQMIWLCKRLGIENPYNGYERWYRNGKLRVSQIRKLTAKERNEIHFKTLAEKEWRDNERVRNEKYSRNGRNAFVWIVGKEPVKENIWIYPRQEKLTLCRNMWTGEIYDLRTEDCWSRYFWFFDHYVTFDYDSFRKSPDKTEWIRSLYAKCEEVQKNIIAQNVFARIKANSTTEKIGWSTYIRFLDDEYLAQNTTAEELAVCRDFISRLDAYLDNKATIERAEAIRCQREKEERQREKELQEKLKAEQIEECLQNGVEGGRNLWRFHYMNVEDARRRANIPEFQFFDGGNVLMRFGMKKDLVETSMSIKLDIPTCKKFWKLVNIWHNNPSKFRETKIETHYSGTYTIVSYENDILTAGCHRIAYAEMERMYNSIIENEKVAG